MGVPWTDLEGVVWDWGDTLMRDIPGQTGAMASWPRVEAMPGAAAALIALAVVPLQCVATNAGDSDASAVKAALARVGLGEHIDRVFTSRELGARKPDPAFFRRVSRDLGVPPARLLAVGNDLDKDVLPAGAAGLTTVWVASSAERDSEAEADLVVPDLVVLAAIARRSLPRR